VYLCVCFVVNGIENETFLNLAVKGSCDFDRNRPRHYINAGSNDVDDYIIDQMTTA